MKKTDFNFVAARERVSEIKERILSMTKALEDNKEREAFTEDEEKEQRALFRELSILENKIAANTVTVEVNRREDIALANEQLREAIKNHQPVELKIGREVATSGYASGLQSTNPFGLTTQSVVEPLYAKTILSVVGAPLLTGLKGNMQWPVVEAFEASVAGEGVALGDTKIPLSKLIAHPERLGVTVPFTRELANETDGLVETIATQYIPVAIADLMNGIMFSEEKVNNATALTGPFVDAGMEADNIVEYTGDLDLKTILSLKGKVLNSNIAAEQVCYVMNEVTKAELEATPKTKNGLTFIIDENGKINGLPVFTTSKVKTGTILFGAFKYAPQGIFGDFSFIIDPYTGATKNEIRMTMNVDYAITTLRKQAFAKLKKQG